MKIKEKLIALNTLFIKEMKRVFRIWTQTLLPPAITTILYFMIFGHVMGSRIGSMSGYSYIQFIAPGLIMMQIITSSYSGAVSSFFSIKFQRSIEELLVSPMPSWVIVLGFTGGGVLRGLIVGLIVSAIALFFTKLHLYSFAMMFLSALMAATIFSLAGFINAIFAKKFDDVAIVPTFVLTPLTYLGGVFYSISLLPSPWNYFSLGNPIVYIVSAFRYGFLGVTEAHLFLSVWIMLSFIVGLFAIALWLMGRGVGLRT